MTYEEWQEEFVVNLKKRIKNTGLTQREFCEEAGIAFTYLRMILDKRRKPSVLHIINIANALDRIAEEKGEDVITIDDIIYFGESIELEKV